MVEPLPSNSTILGINPFTEHILLTKGIHHTLQETAVLSISFQYFFFFLVQVFSKFLQSYYIQGKF